MKDSFILFTELVDTVKDMSEEAAGALFKMILNYEADRDLDDGVEEMAPEAYVAFSFIKRQLERTDQKYQDTIEKRRSAGKTGAEKRWQNIANDSKAIANDSKPIANDSKDIAKIADNVPVPVNDNVYPTDIKKRGRFTPPSIEEVRAYCIERGNNVDAETFVDFYASKGWKVGNNPMKDWKACVRTWEKRDNRASPKDKPFNITNFLLEQIKEGEDDL